MYTCPLYAAMTLMATSQAAAQGGDAFVGTSKSILKSSICTRLAMCSPTGSAVVLGEKRMFYHLKLKNPTAGGLNDYDLYVTTYGGVTTNVVLLYPGSNGDFSDGKFRLSFFTAATGVSFPDQPKAIQYSCSLKLRGINSNYIVNDVVIGLDGAHQVMTMVMAVGPSAWAFRDIPEFRKVTYVAPCP
ncbi:hypothetical protein GCM10008949_50480 [Deinococcus humi]|nr:hypothetical protein GCM10008949_50480 [Deinococcus humi]